MAAESSEPWSRLKKRLHYRRSLASRVTVLTTMAVAVAVTAVAFAAYATVRAQSISSLDESLQTRAAAAAEGGALDELSRQDIPPWALGAADVKILFLNVVSGLRGSDDQAAAVIGHPELDVARGTSDSSARTVSIGGERYRMVAVPAGNGEALILAQSLEATDRTLDRLGLVMSLIGLAGVITAGLAGWGVARNGLRPVRQLTTAVEDITRTERLSPIHVEGRDEVARLARAFNAMLAALSASQHRQRQLVADAGHELRTPLTSLRTNLELLAQTESAHAQPLSAPARRELLDDVRGQIGELTTLIGDLVELARDTPEGAQIETVELAAVVGQAVARVRRRAPALDFDVHTEPWWVTGDAGALERAITNLLDNAAKWSPSDGTVRVELREGTVTVADQGRGISPVDLPHVFERFYRSTDSRGLPGSGLGLSIVKSVADRHGGAVSAGAGRDGGAEFWFFVPGTKSPPEAASEVAPPPNSRIPRSRLKATSQDSGAHSKP